MKPIIYAGLLALPLMMSPETAKADDPTCALQPAMQQARSAQRQRTAQMHRAGIQERNSSVVDALPTVSRGACLDQIYQVMDNVTSSMQSPLGSYLSRTLTDSLSRMTCDQADRYYRELLNTEIGQYDDRLGVIRSGGDVTGYDEGRTTRVDVRRAIELGRQAGTAVQSLPTAPPGRGGDIGQSTTYSNEGVRNAINGL
jgi:hypothetical protein